MTVSPILNGLLSMSRLIFVSVTSNFRLMLTLKRKMEPLNKKPKGITSGGFSNSRVVPPGIVQTETTALHALASPALHPAMS